MSVEQLSISKEIESNISYEIERKFLPLFPDVLEAYRTNNRRAVYLL